MLCRNPITMGMHLYPCGQCMPCRFNRRREWTHRIMLEASLRTENAFVTLTYSDENLRMTSQQLPTLDPKDFQDWLKRFRAAISPLKVRFYGVGEYGDETQRPHYHVALFGYPPCRYGNSRYRHYTNCCDNCDRIRDTWGKGNIFVGTLETESAQYVAGYVTKKMTAKDDERLLGRHPEFARMSLRPGIGADFMHDVASVVLDLNLVEKEGDVPSSLRHGKRVLPLGRYLTKKLRKLVGQDEKAPQATLDKIAEEMRPLREAARISEEIPSVKDWAVAKDTQRVLQMDAKAKVFKKRRSI